MSSNRRRYKKKRIHYNPSRMKTIRTKQISLDIFKGLIGCLVLYAVIMTLRCNYYIDRSNILESGVDSFYAEDGVSDIRSLDKLGAKMTEISNVYKLALNNYISIKDENQKLEDKITNIIIDAVAIDYENCQLIASNNKYYDQLMSLKEREELFDKYEYAIIYEGERTDIQYDQLKTGIDIMVENDIDPNILFSVIMTESKGQEDAQNSTSTASGYGQILASTGKSVYEKYMDNEPGSFDREMLLDGETNITIAANYLAQLIDTSSDLTQALYKYRGVKDSAWLNKVNGYLVKGGTSLAEENMRLYYR